jgi:hypothetical protein
LSTYPIDDEFFYMETRIILRVEITPQAKQRLAQITEANGMTQVAVTSRLVEWFAGQPDLIQAAILGRYPKEIEPDIAKLILSKMANGKK